MSFDLQSLDPQDWSTIQPLFDDLLARPLDAEQLDPWLQQWSDLSAHLGESAFRAYRATSENTADKAAEERFMHLIQEIDPKVQMADQQLKQKLLAADTSKLSATHSQMLRRFRTDAELFREANLPLLTELQRLSNEYDKLSGAMAIEIDQQTLTLPQATKLLQSSDRELRERVSRAISDRYLQDREALNRLFLEMLPLRHQLASNAGLSSYIEYAWQNYGRFDYTPADCRTFHQAIEREIVPLVHKYYQHRQNQLGLDRLRPWDLDVDPLGRAPLAPFTDVAELEEVCQHMFNQLDPELGAQYSRMRKGYLDLDSRANKAPGGYCGWMMVTRVPYIFMNAVGTHNDVQTLLHESGHAFHATESARHNDLIWNYGGPMEFCEVASMGMEFIAGPYLDREQGGFYSTSDTKRARAEHLLDSLTFLPYMALVDAFQHWLYGEAPKTVSAAELDAKWGELWDRFMVGVDWSGLEAEKVTGWHRKIHIFTAPLYYVEYGLASVGALQIWRNALKDQAAAVAQYRQALALGNTRPLPELFAAAGARFAFDQPTLHELAELAEQHLEIYFS